MNPCRSQFSSQISQSQHPCQFSSTSPLKWTLRNRRWLSYEGLGRSRRLQKLKSYVRENYTKLHRIARGSHRSKVPSIKYRRQCPPLATLTSTKIARKRTTRRKKMSDAPCLVFSDCKWQRHRFKPSCMKEILDRGVPVTFWHQTWAVQWAPRTT